MAGVIKLLAWELGGGRFWTMFYPAHQWVPWLVVFCLPCYLLHPLTHFWRSWLTSLMMFLGAVLFIRMLVLDRFRGSFFLGCDTFKTNSLLLPSLVVVVLLSSHWWATPLLCFRCTQGVGSIHFSKSLSLLPCLPAQCAHSPQFSWHNP